MSRRAFGSGVIVLTVCGAAALAFAAADWSAAERKFEEFRRKHEQLRGLTPDETKKIVTAVCEAEEEDRQSVARDASQRVRDKIEGEYEELEEIKGDALELIDAVLADSAQKDRHGKAREYRGKVTEWWTSIERMTRSLRGANHPVVAFMLKEGQAAHKSRQSSSSHCDVSAFRLGSAGEADCLKVSGCKVIELKPDNSRAIRAGRSQAQLYAAELNKKGDAFNNLVKKDSDFAKCTRFEIQIDCYTLCPDINDDGEFRSAAPRWRERC
jgi:Restriction endonuclease fold toxin 9